MPAKRVRVLKSTVIYQGRIFGVRQERVVEPGNVVVTRDVVAHNGSVVLLPVFSDGRILLVRQYRHPARQFLWELVAGRIEPGENFLAAARRELLEETGYTARRYWKLLDFFPTPGYNNERMVMYAAEGLRPGPARPESDERITTRRFSLSDLERMMRRGTLCDAKSIAGVLYYARFRQAKPSA